MTEKNIKHRRLKKPFRVTLTVLALIISLAVGVGGTLAYLSTKTDDVKNTFVPSHVSCEVTETFENNIKNNVRIHNTSDIDAYIRTTVVVNWKDSSGNVYAAVPVEGTDYRITYNLDSSSKWFKGTDGYYYYSEPVGPDNSKDDSDMTQILITECKPIDGKNPSGYTLSVEILCSAIQSVPTTTVESVWPVTVDYNGKLTVK